VANSSTQSFETIEAKFPSHRVCVGFQYSISLLSDFTVRFPEDFCLLAAIMVVVEVVVLSSARLGSNCFFLARGDSGDSVDNGDSGDSGGQ
jgi:hypothetical protein